jgi:membrane fusion protein, multidrug efflux system
MINRSIHLGIVFFVAVFAEATHATQPTAPTPLSTSYPAIFVAAVLDKPSIDWREIRAQLSPRNYTTLAAEIGAKISRIPVQEGSSFRAGQSLVAFDCSMQQAQLQKARAVLIAAERTYHANKRLAELNSVGKVELDVSEAEVAKGRSDVSLVTVAIGKCAITAPFSGRVVEQKAREQQYVQAGQPLLELLDDSVLELEFIVPSRWLTWLRAGSTFQVTIDETAKAYPAKVRRMGAKVDPISQSIKVVAIIDGRFPELMAGMSGQVDLAPPVK